MKCIWVEKKECPYLMMLENVMGKKEMPQLEDFLVYEICKLCLMATAITLKR